MKRISSAAVIILTAISVLAGVSAAFALAPAGNDVRVRIFDGREAIHLQVKARYAIHDAADGRLLMEGPHLKADVRGVAGGLVVGEAELSSPAIRISAAKDADIYVNWKRFRGDVGIIKTDNGKLMAVNHIDIEDYLYGVLFHEVSHRWPMEVLKAQAIAARTFALYQTARTKEKPYDLTSDVYSQVYGGRDSERWSTVRAVNLTKGKVLAYKGEIFPAYFHATCAGFTENASNLWKIDIEPLKGGVFCPNCRISPHYLWHREIPLTDVEKKLGGAGYKTGRIESIRPLGRNASGRVDKLEITDEAGKSVLVPAKDFRLAVGPNDVRSTRFIVKLGRGNLVLDGLGWGHGAGMCQWGAYGLARKGRTAEEILRFYYPGAEIVNSATL